MAKNQLIGSSSTKDQLLICIEKYYMNTKFEITEDNKLKRLSDGKVLENVIITQKKNRFRFERII